MLFRNDEASLRLDIARYEFPDVDPGSEDNNWLVVRATWIDENGGLVKDSNSCLQTFELQSLTAGLKVLKAGIRYHYVSDFQEDAYFSGRGGPLPVPCVLLPAQHHGRGRHGGADRLHDFGGAGRSDRRAGPALREIPGPDLRSGRHPDRKEGELREL